MAGLDSEDALNAYEHGGLNLAPIRRKTPEGDEMEIIAEMVNGHPVIRSVTITNTTDTGVTKAGLDSVAKGAAEYTDYLTSVRLVRLFEPDDTNAGELSDQFKKKRRRRLWGPEQLREASRIFLEAERDGYPPRVAVSNHYNISASQAAKVLRQARDSGAFDTAANDVEGEA